MFSTAKLAISFGIAWHPALKTYGEVGGGNKKSPSGASLLGKDCLVLKLFVFIYIIYLLKYHFRLVYHYEFKS